MGDVIEKLILALTGVIFVMSALAKFVIFPDFTFYLIKYLQLSGSLSFFFASALISIELIVGFFLVFGIYEKFGVAIAIILLLAFTPFLIYLMIKIPNAECMCMGNIKYFSSPEISLSKNLILTPFLFFIFRRQNNYTWKAPTFIMITGMLVLFVTNVNVFGWSPSSVQIIQIGDVYDNGIKKEYLLIDARPASIFEDSHIYGAISVPYYGVLTDIKDIKNEDYQSKKIVVYCDSRLCKLSNRMARFISQTLHIKTYVLDGGINKWLKEGLPVVEQ